MLQSTSQTTVKSRAYRLIRPGEVTEAVVEHKVRDWELVLEPVLGSICHADLRYYTGQRRPEALKRKLPMALIHEGVAKVAVSSGISGYKEGDRVVIVPNIPGYSLNGIRPEQCCPACRSGRGENYCHNGRFLGSGFDGIAQQKLVIPASCAIPIPDDIPDEIAVLSELCTVSYQALYHVKEKLENERVAVFGDGPVGYLTAAVLRHVYGVTEDRLHVFGADPHKLDQFAFANRSLVQEYDFAAGETFDIAVECTGGKFSEHAVNQAIDILKPGGQLILMGVTEDRVPINTRDVLEKGLVLRGSSRSSSSDYPPVLAAMRDPLCQETLKRLLPDRAVDISAAADFRQTMEEAAAHKSWTKVLLNFRW